MARYFSDLDESTLDSELGVFLSEGAKAHQGSESVVRGYDHPGLKVDQDLAVPGLASDGSLNAAGCGDRVYM